MKAVIDIGGTSIKYGIMENGNLIFHQETPTDAKKIGGPGIVKRVTEILHGLQKNFQYKAIGISTAGMVDHMEGTIIYANENIPHYTGTRLKAILEKEFDMTVSVENDVNSAALGEYVFGAAKGSSSMVCITVGTGVGGAIVIDGKIHHGFSNSAGEIGYMRIKDDILENLASTTALVNMVKSKKNQELNGREIFQLAKNGDKDSIEAIDTICNYLAMGITNICQVINPEIVVLGGGIMAQKEYLLPIIEKHLKKYMNEKVHDNTKIAFAKLENTAGLYGAYCV